MTQDELAAAGRLPRWLGDKRLHRSHRSKLLAKDPLHYGRFFTDVPPDVEYFWPDGDEDVDAATGLDSSVYSGDGLDRLWVVQPENPEALGRFLQGGLVALGTGSGIVTDAAGQDLAGLREMLGAPTRRLTRPLIALARFLTEIAVGDEIAVLIDGGRRLLVGVVEGPYEFAAGGGESTAHRRPVRWDRVIQRSAVTPMASLQDVRPLFGVRLAQPAETEGAETEGAETEGAETEGAETEGAGPGANPRAGASDTDQPSTSPLMNFSTLSRA